MASNLSPGEIEAQRLKELQEGPMSILYNAAKDKTTVMVNCRNNKKLIAKVKAFDRHCNMILENVNECWTEIPKVGRGAPAASPIVKQRVIPKLFLRGDSVITVIAVSN